MRNLRWALLATILLGPPALAAEFPIEGSPGKTASGVMLMCQDGTLAQDCNTKPLPVTITASPFGIATAALQTAGNAILTTISGTLSTISSTLTTISGAVATAANQVTANASLATIATNTTGASTAANQTTANSSLATIGTNTGNTATNTGTIAGAISAGKMQATVATALPAGSAIIGKAGIDQTTPGTTNGVQVVAALPAGANAIGSVTTTPSAIAPLSSTAAESSHVIKASAGTLYGVAVTTGATAGYLMVFNATSAPADGAVTPLKCVVAQAGNTTGLSPDPNTSWSLSTGITAVFSSTGCFTKTASATAMFTWQAQ